ncbi:amine oxidase [Tricladium varicosporioides]|nr:amine oxidase [Hymenoscyphus varicosporioides]
MFIGLLVSAWFASAAIPISDDTVSFKNAATSAERVIYKDVAILGGGASGSHAAVRLREDYNKSIILIEKQANLGGHVETYIDPISGAPYDYGVNSYTEYGGAKAFFTRFNVSLVSPARKTLNTSYVDFTTGKPLIGYQRPTSANVTMALTKYLKIAEQYESMLLPGYFNLPSEIPEELLTKFSDFVAKYGLEAAVPSIQQVTGFALGNFGEELVLYVMQEFNAPMARTFLGINGGWVPSSHRNQDIYDNIATLLGNDVLYSATVLSTERHDTGVELSIQNDKGEMIRIVAKKLLVSFGLTPDNVAPLKLSKAENDVFSTWNLSTGYCGIVTHPSLPINGTLVNTPASAVPTNYLALPAIPFVTRFEYMGDKNFRVLFTGTHSANWSIPKAQSYTNEALSILAAAGTVPSTNGISLNFAAFTDHTTTHSHVSADIVRAGFYKKLYALQGERSTFYTGRAWTSQFTTILWEYNNQYLLPKLLASL